MPYFYMIQPHEMRANTLFQELHRRHVFKAAVAYAVVAWLIVQVLSIMIPAFNLPDDFMPFSIVVMVLCFPVWLTISWFYDLTEDGIVKTRNIEEEEVVSTKSVNLNKVIITSLSVTVILLVMNTFRMKAENKKLTLAGDVTQSEAIKTPEFTNSIAVLAFADMSPEQDQEFLALGISEEIIHRLNQIKDLRVPSRTSSFSFRDKAVTHQIIADDLNVAYILEGSIRLSNNTFRITAQLIDGSDGSHIWSQIFDREIEDVLYTQDEIARLVAERMEVTLNAEDVRLRKVDPEAYLLFLKANEALGKYHKSGTITSDSLIQLSIKIDDSYSPAWTTFSRVLYRKAYHYFLMDPDKAQERGVDALMKAIELDEQNALAYAWMAQFEWQNKNAQVSEKHLKTSLHWAPNDPGIIFQAAKFTLGTNRLKAAKEYLNKAILLDPSNSQALYYRGFVNWTLGDLEGAEKDLLLAYRLDLPDYLKNYEMALLSRDLGRYDEALDWLGKEENQYLKYLLRCSIDYAMGKETEAMEMLERLKSYPRDEHMKRFIDTEAEHHYELACLYAFMNDYDNTFLHLDKAFDHIIIWPERLFSTPDFNALKSDLRWEGLLIRLGNELGFNFIQD